MFKYIFSKVVVYLILLVFVVPIVILVLLGNASRKTIQENAGLPLSLPSSSSNTVSEVPLPTGEDVVRTFCNLINQGKIIDAVNMMDIEEDSVRQSYAVSFNNFSRFDLVSIQKNSIDETGNSFEVDIDILLKKDLGDLPIPNYGWENGINKRWISLIQQEDGTYKIKEIATGP